MSSAAIKENEAREEVMLCASCGIAGSDDIKLMKCTACYLVKYCSVICQKNHRPQHKKECKKRAAELRDELLFKQTESSCYGDCPICMIPLPLDESKSMLATCCSKMICKGCNYANKKREYEGRLQEKCAFCRTVVPSSDEEENEQWIKRIEVNDPFAICEMGIKRRDEGDYEAAIKYLTSAAALGDVRAHYQLSCLYGEGKGVEKDEKKFLHHLEKAAIGGHPDARHNLACKEGQSGQYDRAMKHYIIAANLGHDKSMGALKQAYKARFISKEDFAAALRGHHAAIEATKSPQRKAAAEFYAECKRRGI